MRDGYSLADISAATRGNDGGFGEGGWSAWIIIFLIFALGGWGNGFGGFGGNRGNGFVADNYVLASDFATIQRQLSDGFGDLTAQSRYIQNGICDGFYAMNTSLLNGFAGTNNAIMANGYETRNAINSLSSDLASCCCQTQRAIDGVNYNMATNTCAITNNATQNTRDIIDAINCSYNNLHNEILTNRMEDLRETNRALAAKNTSLELAASQSAQNAYLLDQLKPCAKPSYVVQPSTPVTFPTNCCGQYTGCNTTTII